MTSNAAPIARQLAFAAPDGFFIQQAGAEVPGDAGRVGEAVARQAVGFGRDGVLPRETACLAGLGGRAARVRRCGVCCAHAALL
jgi:hypothetical protein